MLTNKENFKAEFETALKTIYAKPYKDCSKFEKYFVLAELVTKKAGGIRSENLKEIEETDKKMVYYFSMEFLIGRLLENYLLNLGALDIVRSALAEMGDDLDELLSFEPDPGLGNGGLGRLAACFLDSMAALGIAGSGIGLRYKFGLFRQKIINGQQVEYPDSWLENEYPWENKKVEYTVVVRFGGYVDRRYENGEMHYEHKGYQCVLAVPYDVPIVGAGGHEVGLLHLFDAQPMRSTIDMDAFNRGDYAAAMKERCDIDAMTSILYPDDSMGMGRRLRLRQEYLLTAGGIGNIIRQYKKRFGSDAWRSFPDRVSIHINDTHPTLCIPELIRVLLDQEGLNWDDAWYVALNSVSFTNHTVLPEALEKWPIDTFRDLLPRVYMIIEEIDRRYREQLEKLGLLDFDTLKDTAILWDGMIRMANLSVIGSHSTNGVAALHTEILKNDVFSSFNRIYPERFNNKTNGISHRRFMIQSNPLLADLITRTIGDDWLGEFDKIKDFAAFADDETVTGKLRDIKTANKTTLAEYIKLHEGIDVNINSIFDVQVKRFHAYKRQLLNVLKILHLYNTVKDDPSFDICPCTFIFAGKAAQGYAFAKEVVHLINTVALLVNNDPDVNKKLQVVFIENFRVSNAQLIYPAADISEQISTAGKEASGTGNMKFMMNGAVTLGTLDGANIEILEQVGEDNIEIFGLTAEEIMSLNRQGGYNSSELASSDPRINRILAQLIDGTLKDEHGKPVFFWSVYDELTSRGDEYYVLKDFDAYIKAYLNLDRAYRDVHKWERTSLLNIASSAFFSSDRTIREYADDIWNCSHR